jgi:hypothetical protein
VTNVSLTSATAAVYALLAVIFVFTYETNAFDDHDVLAWIYVGTALLIQPLTGFLIPRLWAFALPFVAFVVSLPFSEPDPEYFGITDAGVMLAGGVFAMILMAFGMACRLTIEAFRNPGYQEPPLQRNFRR